MTTEEKSEQQVRREREHQRRDNRATQPPLACPFETQVSGVTHHFDYPWGLNQIREELEKPLRSEYPEAMQEPGYWRQTQWVEFVREPDNEYDPNAIAVHWNGNKIGNLNSVLARRMAPELDAGIEWMAYICEVGGDEDQPGCTIRCRRQETTTS